jgi:eukaryotic-like serine/threonine-protein kinase
MGNLPEGYRDAGQLALALPLYEETLKLTKAKLGADHPRTLMSMNNLACGYLAAGKLELALPLFEKTLMLQKAKLGPDHPDTLTSMSNLARSYQDAGKLELALVLYAETLTLKKAKLGPDHPGTLIGMNNLAKLYQQLKNYEEAVALFEQLALAIEKRQYQDSFAVKTIRSAYICFGEAGQFEKADRWCKKWLAVYQQRNGDQSLEYARELVRLGLYLTRQQKWAEVEAALRECLPILEKMEPDAWTTFNTMSVLGGALLSQKKHAEAEPLLLKGYAGMKQRADKIPPHGKGNLSRALERLVQLYEATNKPDEAAKWKKERADVEKAVGK